MEFYAKILPILVPMAKAALEACFREEFHAAEDQLLPITTRPLPCP
jgi:hypothetical protein